MNNIPLPAYEKPRAAVLCPGPSLIAWEHEDKTAYDVVIAVNRAASVYPCHYWSTLDWFTPEMCEPLTYKPIVITKKKRIPKMEEAFKWMRDFDYVLTDDFIHPDKGWPHSWALVSATAAIWLARCIGAKTITCFGMDMSGTQDFDYFTDTRQLRTDDRWSRERKNIRLLTEKLRQEGVSLTRRSFEGSMA